MARNSIKSKELAEHLGVRIATIYDKLNGHYDFSLNEAIKIKRHFFPDYDLEYLFDNGGDNDESRCPKHQSV